jgi:sensor histidine kinase YesM
MIRKVTRRCAIAFAAWLPFFAIWFLIALSSARAPFAAILIDSLVSMGSAGVLGIGVWFICRKWPLPLGFQVGFDLRHLLFAVVYGAALTSAVYGLEFLIHRSVFRSMLSWSAVARELLLGIWIYAIFAGMFYAVQTRNRLHEKETLAARAEALAASARLDALRARLNPHFLFNALHTLAALVKFRPAMAEGAIERLGDMLRYTLKEDGRGLVEFSEEYNFTRQYLAFEQLRYDDRLKVDLQVDPGAFNFDVPPFSIQTLAENAVHHAISIRPEGGSLWVNCSCRDSRLTVTVRDDGPGAAPENGQSHQFGLRSLQERLRAAYGPLADLRIQSSPAGFEASFAVPASEPSSVDHTVGERR